MLTAKRCCTVFILCAILLALCACSSQPAEQAAPELLTNAQSRYTTVEVEVGEFSTTVSGNASVVYPVQRDLVWSGKNATIGQILVKRGEAVTEGQPLIRMQISYNSADLAQWKLQKQRAQEELAEKVEKQEAAILEAKQALAGLVGHEKTLAELSVQKLELALEELRLEGRIELDELQEKISDQEQLISNNVLKAPFDGIIDYVVNMSEGDPVSANAVLIRLHSPDTMLFKADGISSKLYYNMPVTVNVGRGSAQRSFVGVVVGAPNVLPSSLNSDTAYIKLANNISADEISGSVGYQGSSVVLRNVLVLDAQAIHREDGKTYVNILSNGTVEKRFVVIQSNGSDLVWVIDGLQEGQRIIVD